MPVTISHLTAFNFMRRLDAISLLLLAVLLIVAVSSDVDYGGADTKQKNILHDAVKSLFTSHGFGLATTSRHWPYKIQTAKKSRSSSDISHVESLCSNLAQESDRKRLLCCPQSNGGGLYLHNVKIERGKMVFFSGSDNGQFASNADGTTGAPPSSLPPITSLVRRQKKEFQMTVEVRPKKFSQAKCSAYFNGTLHVMGHLTTQNLYHVLNDNVVPLLSLVVLDAFHHPDLLYADRALLTGIHPPADREQVPHLAGLLSAAIPTSFALGGSAEGVCFRRVAWGGGVKVMYQHLLGAVRSLSAALLREITVMAFNPADPYPIMSFGNSSYAHSTVDAAVGTVSASKRSLQMAKGTKRKGQKIQQRANDDSTEGLDPSARGTPANQRKINTLSVIAKSNLNTSTTAMSHQQARRPMNVVIYTRGSSGVGRTIQGEELLRDRLLALGARAAICCDFRKVSLSDQLGYAVHADAIIGLHGAGLINNLFAPTGTITVELKTIYGYGLTLFAVSSDARQGSFVEINIKDYHIWGKPGQSRNKPIDEPLMSRITDALFTVLGYTESSQLALAAAEQRGVGVPVPHTPTMQDQQKLLHTAQLELNTLINKNLQRDLFVPLQSTPSVPRPRGDLTMYSYPNTAFEAAMTALAAANQSHYSSANNHSAPTASLSSETSSQLDFLFHPLGPQISDVHAQCARLTVSAYWEHLHVTMKDVHERYCVACTLPVHSNAVNTGTNRNNDNGNTGSMKALPVTSDATSSSTSTNALLEKFKLLESPKSPRNQQQQHQHKQLMDGLLKGNLMGQQKNHHNQHNQHRKHLQERQQPV